MITVDPIKRILHNIDTDIIKFKNIKWKNYSVVWYQKKMTSSLGIYWSFFV